MKKFSFIFILSLFSSVLFAVPATPNPINVQQPDGEMISIRFYGDEFLSFTTSEDGYLIVQDENGYYVYASLTSDRELEPTLIRVQNAPLSSSLMKSLVKKDDYINTVFKAQHAKTRAAVAPGQIGSGFPTKGSPKILVILTAFPDRAFSVANANNTFTKMLSQENYKENGFSGSAADYFKEASFGQFTPEFDVVGPYTMPNNMAYYGGNPGGYRDRDAYKVVIDACAAAHNAGVNLADYDSDGDGIIDMIAIIYAGLAESNNPTNPNLLWPKRDYLREVDTSFGGKKIGNYIRTSELLGSVVSASNLDGIGTFCHEFSHVLGLMDMYNETNFYTPWVWSLMHYGCYLNGGKSPVTYSSLERFYLGYVTPTQITEKGSYTLKPLIDSNQVYLIAASEHNLNMNNPSPKEFFLLENRQLKSFDTALYGKGMLIWHITYNATNWGIYGDVNPGPDAKDHGIYIVRANGFPEGEKQNINLHNFSQDPFPGTAGITTFAPTLWNGTVLPVTLSSIRENAANGNITFSAKVTPTDVNKKQNDANVLVTVQDKNIYIQTAYTISNIRICNALGQIVAEGKNTQLSVPENGLYIIQVYTDQGVATKKILVR